MCFNLKIFSAVSLNGHTIGVRSESKAGSALNVSMTQCHLEFEGSKSCLKDNGKKSYNHVKRIFGQKKKELN